MSQSQATLPVPSTYASGLLQTSELTGDVTNAIAWLLRPPFFIGSQQPTTAQTISNNSDVAINMDTELIDSVNGHRINSNQNTYYGMIPGWYLCEASCGLNYTGGTGYMTAGVGGSVGGSAITNRLGDIIANFTGFPSVSTSSHLIQMKNTGTFGSASNDFVQLIVRQTTGSNQTPQNDYNSANPGRAPYLSVEWVGAATGVANLPLPANPAWPVPPSYVTSSFLNANIRDVINFLVYPPMISVQYSAAASLASQGSVPSLGTAITLGSHVLDNYGAYSGSTWTAPVNGVYYCYGQVGINSATVSVAMAAGLNVTSSNYGGSNVTLWGDSMSVQNIASDHNAAIVRRMLRLNAGDKVQLAGFQNSSDGTGRTILDSSSEWATRMIILWRSA